jgi:hypothetical protein
MSKIVFYPQTKKMPRLTQKIIAEAEKTLACQFPKAYLDLLRERNGGACNGMLLPLPKNNGVSERPVSIGIVFGIYPHNHSLESVLDTPYMAKEWGLPDRFIIFSGEGHWWLGFDYSRGPTDPKITFYDCHQGKGCVVASSFEEMLDKLEPDTEFEE